MMHLPDPEEPQTHHDIDRVKVWITERLLPLFVAIFGVYGLIAYLLNISALKALSYLLLTTPLPLAYSAPEIAAEVTVSLRYQDGARVTRLVTRQDLAKIDGPLQRRTALIYLFTKPDVLGAKLVSPALHHLFCAPGVLLSELELTHSAPLSELTWALTYPESLRGDVNTLYAHPTPKVASYQCHTRVLELRATSPLDPLSPTTAPEGAPR